jgi:molecular chaperone DnaK (HSP70)
MGSDTITVLNGKEYLPEEISGMILRHIKDTAEKQFDQVFSRAVITVPAYFSDDQRKATAIAGEIAGFKVERIINEPTAASLAYNYNHQQEIKAIVYDFGGGTFDVSVVNISNNMVEVIASHGNNQLGGDDIDFEFRRLIAELISEKYETTIDPQGHAGHQLLQIAEKCKIELSDHPYITIFENIHIEKDTPPLAVELEISREQFEEILHPFIEQTLNLMHIALNDANLDAKDIDQILLVGGTSKIPLIASEFQDIFNIAPSGSINPDQSVCLGAAIQGAIIDDSTIKSILVDVTPYTFGTRAASTGDFGFIDDDDVFVPVITKNSPLPTSKSKMFYKMHPDQPEIQIEIYQGEEEAASDNKLIGSFKVINLSRKDDDMEILLTMNLDLNGILTVIATEKITGRRKQITIENSFQHDDISASLNKLAEVFDDNSETIPEVEAEANQKQGQKIYVAQTMIDKANSKLDLADPDDASEMKDIIKDLEQAIQAKELDQIETLTDSLTDILFYVD